MIYFLSPNNNKDGYGKCNLCHRAKSFKRYIHRMLSAQCNASPETEAKTNFFLSGECTEPNYQVFLSSLKTI
jgi:hypothetical protein